MDTQLDHLVLSFRATVFQLLARFVEARIPVVIVNTLRTAREQEMAIARGVSWISTSKHQSGLAIDVCPLASYLIHGENKLQWDGNDPVWERMGRIGEALGLIWGGRWGRRDLGHFEQGA